jgi:hypothetical protein
MGGGPPRCPGMLSGPAAGPESQDRTLSVTVDWLLEQNGRSIVEPSRY